MLVPGTMAVGVVRKWFKVSESQTKPDPLIALV